MLRVDNGNVEDHNPNIKYEMRPVDKCTTRRAEYEKIRKSACDPNAEPIKLLNDMHRKNSCKVHYCVPTKTCMAKVGLHDANGNFLTQSLVSANLDGNMRINNQIGYVYQERTLIDNDALINALRAQNPIGASVAQKIQLSNNELFGKPTAWDGTDSGYHCPIECPKKSKPCIKQRCKKGDPLFHPEIGIGSDGLEAKRDLREINMGRNFQVRLETARSAVQIPNPQENRQERVAIKEYQDRSVAPTNPAQQEERRQEQLRQTQRERAQQVVQTQALKAMQTMPTTAPAAR